MTSLFSLDKVGAGPNCASQPIGPKPGSAPTFGAWWRRCWARLRGKKTERAGLENGVRVFIRANEMACLPPTGVSIWGHLVFTFLPCTTAHTTLRKSSGGLCAQDPTRQRFSKWSLRAWGGHLGTLCVNALTSESVIRLCHNRICQDLMLINDLCSSRHSYVEIV